MDPQTQTPISLTRNIHTEARSQRRVSGWGALGIALLLGTSACHKSNKDLPPAESMGSTPAATTQQAVLKGKVGVAVTTASRSCVALENPNMVGGTPLTLVSPGTPQTTMQAEISQPASSACPITKDVDPAVNNYEIHLANPAAQKLTPYIAVVGNIPATSADNGGVQMDLQQNQRTETFRACGTQDGIHLTVWQGVPLTGTMLWHGFFYDPSNAATYPACTPKETTGP
jgi:hypothetical protein